MAAEDFSKYVYKLPPEVIQEISTYFDEKFYPKNTFIFKEGQICERVYYIKSGLIKCFFYEQEKENVTWFAYENFYSSLVDSLLQNRPSKYNMFTIEDSVIESIHIDDLLMLAERFPDFNRIILKIMYKALNASISKGLITQSTSAKVRYLKLIETSPEIIKRVPLKDIASFLGISQETLSRIRSLIVSKK